MLHGLPVDLADLVAHVQRGLAVDHPAVHDAGHDAPAVLGHLERDAHRFVGVLLELHQTHTGHVLQFAVVDGIDVVHAAVQVGRDRGRRHPQRLVAVDLSCNYIVSVQKSLELEETEEKFVVS